MNIRSSEKKNLRNVQKCPKSSKNVQKSPKLSEKAQKCPKINLNDSGWKLVKIRIFGIFRMELCLRFDEHLLFFQAHPDWL